MFPDSDMVLPECMLNYFSHIQLFVTPWTIALQTPLFMRLSRQEYLGGLPCPAPGDLPDPGVKPASFMSPVLEGGFFSTSATWKVHLPCIKVSFCHPQKWFFLIFYCLNLITHTGHIDTYTLGHWNYMTSGFWEAIKWWERKKRKIKKRRKEGSKKGRKERFFFLRRKLLNLPNYLFWIGWVKILFLNEYFL